MEIRRGNLMIGTAGGTAGRNAKTYKVSLPSAWVRALGLDAEDKQLELAFDGAQIVIRKTETLREFAERCKGQGHDVRLLRYYDGSILCTTICADFAAHLVKAENHTDRLIKTAFGKHAFPSWEEFLAFLEERCVPRARAGLREYLETLGLDEYAPLELLKQTGGRMAEDDQRLEMEVL